MTAEPHNHDDFTQEPRESDLVVHRAPIYTEESGASPGKPSIVSLALCAACGVAVIMGRTALGDLVPVEPQTSTYSLLWVRGEPYPWLSPSRGYPAHQCRP